MMNTEEQYLWQMMFVSTGVLGQIRNAIAAYKVSDTTRYMTNLDGVDDNVSGLTTTLTGAFSLSIEAQENNNPSYGIEALLGGSAYLTIFGGFFIAIKNDAGTLLTGTSGSITNPYDGLIHEYSVTRDVNNHVEILRDGIVVTSGILAGDITFTNIGFNPTYFWMGVMKNLSIIDHESPLPIGHGGNSGFWPLNDADDVARNILGIDLSGNIIVEDGANLNGWGVWNGLPSRSIYEFSSAVSPNTWTMVDPPNTVIEIAGT